MFGILLKLRFKQLFGAMFQGGKNKNGMSKGKKILFAILFIYVAVVFGALFWMVAYEMTKAFVVMGLGWLVFALIGTMVFFFCILGSVFVIQNQIFEAKDNDILFSMPISPKIILGTRLLAAVLPNYIYELFILVPSTVAYFVAGRFDVLTLIFVIVVAIFLPFLAIVISALFAWIAVSVASKTRASSMISTVIKLVLFGLYMAVMMRLQNNLSELIARGSEIASAFEKYLMPFYFMGKAIADADIGKLFLFILICLVPGALAFWIISKNYSKIVTMKKSRPVKKYAGGEMKVSGSSKALFKKDFKMLTSNSIVLFNSALGQIFLPVLAIYAVVKKDEINIMLSFFDKSAAGAAVSIAFMFILSMVIITSSGISLEAKTLWLIKSIPVSPLDICMSKIRLHVYTTLPFLLVSALILIFTFNFTDVGEIMILALPAVFTVFTAICGMLLNLKFPKLNWLTEAAAVKQSMAAFLSMMVSMASAGIPGIAIYVLRDTLNLDNILIMLFILYTAVTVLLYLFMKKWCDKAFSTLG